MKHSGEAAASFLNVDLEVISERALGELADAFGDAIVVLYLGKQREHYIAALELPASGLGQSPDHLINAFVERIKNLAPSARAIWNGAIARRFDIGVEQADGRLPLTLTLKQSTVAVVAEVNATIAFTIYPKRDDSVADREN